MYFQWLGFKLPLLSTKLKDKFPEKKDKNSMLFHAKDQVHNSLLGHPTGLSPQNTLEVQLV